MVGTMGQCMNLRYASDLVWENFALALSPAGAEPVNIETVCGFRHG